MSLTIIQEIRCPCGEVFESEIYQSVSVKQDPDLKESILAGEFNLVGCPKCQTTLYADHFVLYHDRESELLAFVYPEAMESRRDEIESSVAQQLDLVKEELSQDGGISYSPFLIFGMDKLCHILEIEEEIRDEAQIVAHLAKSLGLFVLRIRPRSVRVKNIPPVLPLDNVNNLTQLEGETLRASALAGLEKIFEQNDLLTHYKSFRDGIASAPQCILEESDFLESC